MKNIIIFLLCLPMAVSARQPDTGNAPKEKCTTIHFEKASIQYGGVVTGNDCKATKITLPQPGDLRFGEDNSSSKRAEYCDPNNQNNDGVMTAEKVQIACGTKKILKGDELILNYGTNLATLTGHISIVKNGVEKQVGRMALLDLSGDKYKIVCIR